MPATRRMETAPKDGTPILVWGKVESELSDVSLEPSWNVARRTAGDARWYVTNTCYYSVWVHATKWAALPGKGGKA